MATYTIKTTLNKNFKPITFRVSGKPHYQIFIELESKDDPSLTQIQKVEYVLHPTFKRPVRSSTDRSQKFRIELRAWGWFVVKVVLYMTDGSQQEFRQHMKQGWTVDYM